MSAVKNPAGTNPLGIEKIGSLMVRFAIPSVTSLVVNSIYNMVDQVFIGQGVGYLGNAGTNIIMPMATVLMALTIMAGAGAATYMSLHLGKNEPEKAGQGVCNAIVAIILIGIGAAFLFEIFMVPVCRFFGATEHVLPYAVSYGRIIVLGFPFSAIACSFGDIIRADCRPKESMAGLLIDCIVNLILDPIFIFICHWGVQGAALATILGQFFSAVFFIWRCLHFTTVPIRKEYFRLQLPVLRKIFALGVSNFITQVSSVIVMAVVNNLIAYYGGASEYGTDIPLAVLGIIVKINGLAASIVLGVATGIQPILSFNYGNGQFGRVKRTYGISLAVSTIILAIARICFSLFPEQIISLFGQESELYVAFAVKCFDIFLLAIPLVGVCVCTSILFQATGKASVAAFLSLTRQVLYFVPAMLLMSRLFGIEGILWGAAISDILAFCTAALVVLVCWRSIFKEAEPI